MGDGKFCHVRSLPGLGRLIGPKVSGQIVAVDLECKRAALFQGWLEKQSDAAPLTMHFRDLPGDNGLSRERIRITLLTGEARDCE